MDSLKLAKTPSPSDDFSITFNNKPYEIEPIERFADEENFKCFNNTITSLDFDELTPIQKYAIPIAMDGKDLVGIAKTGSGKTLAFMLPALQFIRESKHQHYQINKSHRNNRAKPLALVLGPTRELVNQIYESSEGFANESKNRVKVVYGGKSIY